MNITYFPLLWLVIAALVIGIFIVNRSIHLFGKTMMDDPRYRQQLLKLGWVKWALWGISAVMATGGVGFWYIQYADRQKSMLQKRQMNWPIYDKNKIWELPDPYLAETDDLHHLIAHGRDIIAHTQDYFGENGLVRPASINKMNCQNCHLDAGSKAFGNNYFAVQSTYPQLRARSGALETVPKRVNDCFQRSLNGQPLDTTSHEMKAILAYMRWLGTAVPKGEKPKGTGLLEVPFLTRAADPVSGGKLYQAKCASCHGTDGQGLPVPENARNYPPLWGNNSYNEAAGLFRLSRFAGYIKANMPFGATWQNPQLSDDECWDIAAFVNSQPRPKHPFLATDWPKIEKKPFDHPFGPYADTFPEAQHKFGPFGAIVAFYKKVKT